MAIYYNNELKDFYYGGKYSIVVGTENQGLMYYGNVEVNPGIPWYVNPIATSWASTAGITNTDVINAVSVFVNTLQTASIWSKMVAVYPMITDSDVSSTAKTQFTYNLVNPATHAATYFGNASTGSKSGLTNGGDSQTFVTITPATIGNDYVVGFYTNSDAATTDVNDMGVYDPSAPDDGFLRCIAGRNKSGANANVLMQSSTTSQPYNVTDTGPFTGLFGVGGNGTTGYAYRRTTQLGAAANYNNTQRANNYKIGLGSYFQENSIANFPTTKTYQFCFMSTFLDITEFSILATAVNNLQGSIDTIFGTSRKAYV